MSYETLEAGLAATIIGGSLTPFEERDVSLGDYTILSDGHSYACVIDYNNFSRDRSELQGTYLTVWQSELMLAVPYESNDAAAHALMRALRQEIITQVSENPGLGVEAFEAVVVRGEAIPQIVETGAANWMVELIYVDMAEIDSYTEAD